MPINHDPIVAVTEGDIGRPVTYQATKHSEVQHGTIAGLSYIVGKTFVQFPDQNRLLDLYWMRWGHVEGFLK